MVTVPEGLELLAAQRDERPEMRTTGLAGLDGATGGFAAGQVWIVVGTPGQGRSAMACQLAWMLAGHHGFVTQLVSMREPSALMAARVASSVAKIPLHHFWSTGLSGHDPEKLRQMTPRLEAAPLALMGSQDVSIAQAGIPGISTPEALVVDDAHRAGGMFPQRVVSLARDGVVVILTMPRHLVVSDDGIDPEWAEVADVILEIDRPDLRDRTSIRPGEADLHLVRNRWGPPRSDVVAFQAHYSRFVDMTAG